MSFKPGRVSLIVTLVSLVLGVITLPGFFSYWRKAGTGHAFIQIHKDAGLNWDSMDQTSRAPYVARAKIEGLKCAFFMITGQHLPFFLFIAMTAWLLTPSVSDSLRVLVKLAFFGVWLFGAIFLSLGIGYSGHAVQFPRSLGVAIFIYAIVGAFFITLIGIIRWVVRCCKNRSKLQIVID